MKETLYYSHGKFGKKSYIHGKLKKFMMCLFIAMRQCCAIYHGNLWVFPCFFTTFFVILFMIYHGKYMCFIMTSMCVLFLFSFFHHFCFWEYGNVIHHGKFMVSIVANFFSFSGLHLYICTKLQCVLFVAQFYLWIFL